MNKENLFSLIRKEEVVLWAGAGLSIYAGYPSGKQLSKILFDNLTPSEQEQIDPNLLLPKLAEDYCRLKLNNKNSLISILKKTFINFKPVSTKYHDQLASIPHFKTIITTNFDQLLENSFGQKSQSLFTTNHIPYIEKDKTQIFKVHGDLSEPESIIITSSDYERFSKINNENNIFWTVIKKEVATNNVLFLGYDLEDANISVIFDKISEALNSHRKEWFLVAPGLKQAKVNFLISKGIHYINSTAEEFIEELIKNIKDNIIEDFDKGFTSPESLRKFLEINNLSPVLKPSLDSFKIQSLNGINKPLIGKLDFTFKNDDGLIEEFNDFFSGKKFGEFNIPPEKMIEVNCALEGLKIPNINRKSGFTFKSLPTKTTKIDVRFDNGKEFSDILIHIFGSQYAFEIHIYLKGAILKIVIDPDVSKEIKLDLEFVHNKFFEKVDDEIQLFTLLNYLALNEHFTIYNEFNQPIYKKFPKVEGLFPYSQYFLNYFENLKILERHFNIRFVNVIFSSITDSLHKLVSKTISIIKGEHIISDWDEEMSLDLVDDAELTLEEIQNFNKANISAVAYSQVEEEIEIHGHIINLGFPKIEIFEAYFSEVDLLDAKREQTFKIKSKSKKIKISHTKTKEVEMAKLTILQN